MATTSGDIIKRMNPIDASMVNNPGAAEELTKIYADPAEVRSDQAVATLTRPWSARHGFSSNGGAAPRQRRR